MMPRSKLPKLKVKKVNIIELSDWDDLVTEVYKKPYSFQQQDGCQSRGLFRFSVPSEDELSEYDFPNDTVPEIVNHDEQGVSFKAWLARDPKQPLRSKKSDSSSLDLWWARNFYPNIFMIIDDLHKKGIIKEGEYSIDIDW